MIKTFNKFLSSKINNLIKYSSKGIRQNKLQNELNKIKNEVMIPEKNLVRPPPEGYIKKRDKKPKEISNISKNELIDKYKINLPLTTYNDRIHHGNFEYKLINKITIQFYQDQFNLPRDKLWITLDCPPFANGPPHIGKFNNYKGNMYNKVLKDITNRFKIIQGYKVSFTNGFDCYGVDIEDSAMSTLKVKMIF